MNIKYHWKRIAGDVSLILVAIVPAAVAFDLDINQISEKAFPRFGAVMALFAAFLEFRTHDIRAMREQDQFNAVWRSISIMVEGLANTDQAAKIALRNQASLIQSAGMEPAMGKPEEIKDMVVSEKLKSLRHLKDVPEGYYKYNSVVSFFGKVLVVCGTLIWAFGDMAVGYFA